MNEYVKVLTTGDAAYACVVRYALEGAGISIRSDDNVSSGTQLHAPQAMAEQARTIAASILGDSEETPSRGTTCAMVLMHVKYDDFVEDEVEELGQDAVKLCKQHQGFISARQFRVKEGDEQFIVMQWEDEQAFEACKKSSAWLLLMPQWSALQEDGDAILKIEVMTRR